MGISSFATKYLCAATALLFLGFSATRLCAGTLELQPSERLGRVVIEHAPAWQSRGKMSFTVPLAASGLVTSGPLLLKIVYLDQGEGILRVAYRTGKDTVESKNHAHSSRTGTGEFAASYHELPPSALIGPDRRLTVEIRLDGSDGTPLALRNVTVQDTPCEDRDAREILSQPWREPPHFSAPAVAPHDTLKGRVMVGYQGWFRTANDRDDRGWVHWFRSSSDPAPPYYTFDMWPDMRAYPWKNHVPAGGIRTLRGEPAYLFSSTSEAVVRQQFRWMRENRIDGAFLQRFLTSRKGGDDGTHEWVLMNVRKAANAEGRLWAVEYDVSGMPASRAAEALRRDWTWLRDTLRVTDDPYYARENGKPVVFVWGLPFADNRFTPVIADRIVDFFQHDPSEGGNYVIGSLPNQWKHLSPEWLAHARNYDGMQVWQTHNYAEDRWMCAQWGLDYLPHVWPGFSWAHLTKKQVPAAFTDRAGGRFYRQRISQALGAGCDRLFVGMFDEYDEGTAIMPMSDDPPPPGPPAGRFLTNGNEPPNRWLRITGEAADALERTSPARVFDKTR